MNFLNQNVSNFRYLGASFVMMLQKRMSFWEEITVDIGHIACMSQLCLHLQFVLEQHLLHPE